MKLKGIEKAWLGAKQTRRALELGKARTIVIAVGCPYLDELVTLAKKNKVDVERYEGNAIKLGIACGKPFPVSALALMEE